MGFDVPLPIKKSKPKFEELKGIFSNKMDWLFLAGHSWGHNIYNESETVKITFRSDKIICTIDGSNKVLKKGTADLNCLDSVRLIILGGCTMLDDRNDILTFRTLFNKSVFLGFKEQTNWRRINRVLGEESLNFFTYAKDNIDNPNKLVKIWLEVAVSKFGSSVERTFASIDDSGRRWVIDKGKIINDLVVN